jgi:hypothetical protein
MKKITALWSYVEWNPSQPQKRRKLHFPGWRDFLFGVLAVFAVWAVVIPVAILWPNSDFVREFAIQEFTLGIFTGVFWSGFRWK